MIDEVVRCAVGRVDRGRQSIFPLKFFYYWLAIRLCRQFEAIDFNPNHWLLLAQMEWEWSQMRRWRARQRALQKAQHYLTLARIGGSGVIRVQAKSLAEQLDLKLVVS